MPVLNLRAEMATEDSEQLSFELAGPDDISSCFCTGGTTGLPKIAMRTQFSEVFDVLDGEDLLGERFAIWKSDLLWIAVISRQRTTCDRDLVLG